MLCALIAFARLKNVVRCSRLWTIRACSTSHADCRCASSSETIDDDALMAELKDGGCGGITELRHVRTSADKRAAEEIANRTVCEDFEKFKPLFEAGEERIEVRRSPYATRPSYGRA